MLSNLSLFVILSIINQILSEMQPVFKLKNLWKHCEIKSPTGKICYKCQNGFFKFNGSCLKPSFETPIFRALTSSCQVNNCLDCSNNASVCSLCFPGYTLTNNKCETNNQCNVPNCVRCLTNSASICASCQAGYFVNNGGCYVSSTQSTSKIFL